MKIQNSLSENGVACSSLDKTGQIMSDRFERMRGKVRHDAEKDEDEHEKTMAASAGRNKWPTDMALIVSHKAFLQSYIIAVVTKDVSVIIGKDALLHIGIGKCGENANKSVTHGTSVIKMSGEKSAGCVSPCDSYTGGVTPHVLCVSFLLL